MNFQLIDSGWDSIFGKSLSKNPSELRIICPFIKKGVTEWILKFGKPHTLQIITRFNLRDFCGGVSDVSALRLLLENGAEIRGVRNLHAKVYLFDKDRVIVTSANLTNAALRKNHEFGFVSDDSKIHHTCMKYFQNLWKRAGSDLSIDRLAEWESKLNSVVITGSRPSLSGSLPDEGVPAPPFVAPSLVEKAPQAFVKFFGNSATRSPRTTPVFEEVESSGSHWACTYPRCPRQVADGDVLFMGRLVKEPDDIIIYGRAIGIRHKKGRDDATPDDKRRRPFKEKYSHYIRVHRAEFVAGELENGVSLNRLMWELQDYSLASTKKHSEAGKGNTNPRSALRRQPGVKLSDEGHNWLKKELETVFENYGMLGRIELERLDWPEVPE